MKLVLKFAFPPIWHMSNKYSTKQYISAQFCDKQMSEIWCKNFQAFLRYSNFCVGIFYLASPCIWRQMRQTTTDRQSGLHVDAAVEVRDGPVNSSAHSFVRCAAQSVAVTQSLIPVGTTCIDYTHQIIHAHLQYNININILTQHGFQLTGWALIFHAAESSKQEDHHCNKKLAHNRDLPTRGRHPASGGVWGASECRHRISGANIHINYGSILLSFRDMTMWRTTDDRQTDVGDQCISGPEGGTATTTE